MARTTKELADAVIASLDEKYELVYVEYDDQLTDEQVSALVENDFSKLFELSEEWESDNQYAGAEQAMTEAVRDVITEWERDDDEDYSALSEEFFTSEDAETVRETITERDSSDWGLKLAKQTPDVLLRINVIDEDDAYNHQVVTPQEVLTKVKLPITDENVKIMQETLDNASPEFSVLMGYWIVGADVEELYKLDSEVTELTVTNPFLYLGNPVMGDGFISEEAFTGTVIVKREDLRTDKGAFGYGVSEIYGGLNASTFAATLTPVVPAPTATV